MKTLSFIVAISFENCQYDNQQNRRIATAGVLAYALGICRTAGSTVKERWYCS
ncbi:MAG: hypothetical protein ACJA1J_002845 [Sulfitobacter pontiacus]|jgi:hypothetical protein